MAKNANESIQSIKYSVCMMKNPVHPDEPEKAYANIQLNGTVSLGQLAQHIREHGSPYTRDVVLGVITAIVDHTREYLVQGYKVDLGDLGSFQPSFKQKGAVDFDSFTTANCALRRPTRADGISGPQPNASKNYPIARRTMYPTHTIN